MREIKGDLWDAAVALRADATCVTTNAFVKRNGEAVMGRGVAREAAERWPDLPRTLGNLLGEIGTHVVRLGPRHSGRHIMELVAFPVKHHWSDTAAPELIVNSCKELVALANKYGWKTIVLPRPGCGNGGLTWDLVQPILVALFDDRFVVAHRMP